MEDFKLTLKDKISIIDEAINLIRSRGHFYMCAALIDALFTYTKNTYIYEYLLKYSVTKMYDFIHTEFSELLSFSNYQSWDIGETTIAISSSAWDHVVVDGRTIYLFSYTYNKNVSGIYSTNKLAAAVPDFYNIKALVLTRLKEFYINQLNKESNESI